MVREHPAMLLQLSCTICLAMLAAGQTEELVHDMTCTPDANGVLPITIINNYLTEVNVTVNCSNMDFQYSMASGELVILPALFHDWANPEKTYPNSACLLYQMDYNAQGYIIHVDEGDSDVLNDFIVCDYSVGSSYPNVNHHADCNPDDSGIFTLQLENRAETWLFISVACTNDWFTFHVPPNSSVSLPSIYYEWTNYNKTYPNDTCVFIDWDYRYQDVIVYSIESDWDYALDYPGCMVSFGEDVPLMNNKANCPSNYSEQFDVILENSGDVWVYVDVWCYNEIFWYYMAPKSQTIVPAAYFDYHDADKVYPEDTCVFALWEAGYQEILVYSEESDHDFNYEYLSCNYDVGADEPQLIYYIDCEEDPVSVNFENNGTVSLRVELWCSNDWYLFFLEPSSNVSVPAVYHDWTNPHKVYPNDTCVLWDTAPHTQTMAVYAEEPDKDFLEGYADCEKSFGDVFPDVDHTSDCKVDSEGFFSVKLENTGQVWVYVELTCWNEAFQFYLSPGTTEIFPAIFMDWTNSDFIIPNGTCVFEPLDVHYQEIAVYTEESDWDYSFDYIGCDYSIGSDTPKMDYSLDCPDDGEDFQIGLENSGDVWLYVGLDCWNGWKDFSLEPHTITHIDATFLTWTDPTMTYSSSVCVFDAVDHHYQEVGVYAWESDWDYIESYPSCTHSVGEDIPQIDHKTDCVTNDAGEFTLNLVNSGDVWLYVELACWNDWLYYFIAPQSTTNVPAIFNEWTNPTQIFHPETCVFEDWGDYQEVEVYNEEPDFDLSWTYLSCDYSVGEEVPLENHWTDCRLGQMGFFTVTLENPGGVWLYVSLDCRNEMFHFYLEPKSNRTVPAAINEDQELSDDTCLFHETADSAYVDTYTEEPDWDYTDKRIMCRRELAVQRSPWKPKDGLYQPGHPVKTG